jgi:hypothetical protein
MKNLSPKKKSAEEEARKLEESDSLLDRKHKVRVGFKIPPHLKNQLYEESNKTGRSVTDIVVEQLAKRYEDVS